MARIPRMELVADDQAAVYHCVNRCLRGASIAGTDQATGESHEHRRRWILNRLQTQSELLCVELLAFAIEPRQLQLVLRTRPDLAKGLSDVEAARRYLAAIPSKSGFDVKPAPVDLESVKGLVKDRKLLARVRTRLSSLSWFVSQISEPVARNANREDEIRGRFWEGRYHCLPILDGPALAACVAHVDLAPLLSGEAGTLAGCKGSSAAVRSSATKSGKASWLSPLSGTSPARKSAKSTWGGTFGLPISDADYRLVLEWTGKQLGKSERGRFPEKLAATFAELMIAPDSWLTLVRDFQKIFRRAAGTPASLENQVLRTGMKSIHGIGAARELFS